MAQFSVPPEKSRKPPAGKKVVHGLQVGVPGNLQALIDENYNNLLKNMRDDVNQHNKPWVLEVDDTANNIKVYNSQEVGCNLKRMKGVTTIPNTTTNDLIEFMSDTHNRNLFDSVSTVETRNLYKHEEDEHSHEVMLMRCATNQVGPVTARDFVDINYQVKSRIRGGDCYSAGGMNANMKKYYDATFNDEWPERSGTIRGSIHDGCGWWLKQQGNDVVLSYIILSNLQGWFLPIFVNNIIAGTYTTFFSELKVGWKDYLKTKDEDSCKWKGVQKFVDQSNSPQSHKPFK